MSNSHLEQENISFSKPLLSQDFADIIKTVMESYKGIHLPCDDSENFDN